MRNVPRRAALLACLIVLAAGARPIHAQPPGAIDAEVETAPVMLDGQVLFWVRGVTSFPADTRARQIGERIRAVAADRSMPSSIRVDSQAQMERLMAGDRLLAAVLDADAAAENVSRGDLALARQRRIQEAIDHYREARSSRALWRSAAATGRATALLIGAAIALVWLWRRLEGLLRRRVQARVRSVGIQSFEVVGADQIRKALESLFFGTRALVFLGVVLAYAGYVLTQWPWTRATSQSMSDFALAPLRTLGAGLAASIPRLVFLAVLFFLVRFALKLIRLFFESVASGAVTLPRFEREWAIPTYNIVRIGIVAFGLVVAYPYIPGSSSDAFKGVSLFIGIVFSLGSSSAISNVIAGYMLIYRRAFKVGDRVKIGGSLGEVIETRVQVTHLRSPKNEEIIIPNSEILSGEVLNFSSLSRDRGLILHTDVGIGYETPWRQVEAMLLTAAARTPGLGTTPPPFVLLKTLGDFAVVYELNVPCGDVARMLAQYTALHQSVLDVFNEHGVQIMTPAYEGDPREPKIVPPKDWYAAPAVPPVEPG